LNNQKLAIDLRMISVKIGMSEQFSNGQQTQSAETREPKQSWPKSVLTLSASHRTFSKTFLHIV
jgi:hypothetical protein